MNDLIYNNILNTISSNNSFAIGSHVSPDGDNVGSLLAMGKMLELLNKRVYYVETDKIPEYLKFLPGVEKYEKYSDDLEVDVFIAVDCADIDRLGSGKNILLNSKKSINIDHHITNTQFADINLVDIEVSSTGELIYNIMEYADFNYGPDIASCLYTAISTDTGRFLYSNTSFRTFEVVMNLYKTNFDFNSINTLLWQNKAKNSVELQIEVLKNLEFYFSDKVTLCYVNLHMASEHNTSIEDTEDIINFIRDINNVETAVLIKQKKNNVFKISLRSKKYVDVSNIALYYGGGGHKRASGFTYKGNLENLKTELLTKIGEQIK